MSMSIRDYFMETRMINFNPRAYVADMAADLMISLGFVILTLAFIFVPQLNGFILRPVFGVAMILFVPGYALVAALFPGKKGIGGIERAVLSFGLSISVVPLIGLGLNYTQWGVRLDPTAVCLTIFSLACVLIANKRRHDMPPEERFSISFQETLNNFVNDVFGNKGRVSSALTVLVIITLLLSVSLVAFIIATPTPKDKFTELYVLGPDGMANNYPKEYTLGDVKQVIVGVTNHERQNMTYDLVISLANVTQDTQGIDQNNSTNVTWLYSERLELIDGQTWENKIDIKPDRIGTLMKVNFSLFANENLTIPYKECYLWVNVTQVPVYKFRPPVNPRVTPTPIPLKNVNNTRNII